MIKELEQIRGRSEEILGDFPERRAKLVRAVKSAEADLQTLKAQLESAEDLESYDKCAEKIKRQELVLRFAKSELRKADCSTRMAEREYMTALGTCKGIMDAAASEYREKAGALMDQLRSLRESYLTIAEDVNGTLVSLDEAANVLQSKYPYRVYERQGMADRKVIDGDAWKAYALRYEGYTACTLATSCSEAEIEASHGSISHDSVLMAAWRAVAEGYPRKAF